MKKANDVDDDDDDAGNIGIEKLSPKINERRSHTKKYKIRVSQNRIMHANVV